MVDLGQCDGILVISPDGSSDSSSAALLEAMSPYTALISVGANNQYGHPEQTTLDRLAAVGATVYRTDLDGDLEVYVDGSACTVDSEPVGEDAGSCAVDCGS